MKIGEQLKLARNNKQLTQQEVADTLHVSRSTISSWEINRTYPDLTTLVTLSNLYNLSLDKLLKEDDQMVMKIDNTSKKKKIYKILFIVTSMVLVSCMMYVFYWNSYKNNQLDTLDTIGYFLEDRYSLVAYEDDYTISASKPRFPYLPKLTNSIELRNVKDDALYTSIYQNKNKILINIFVDNNKISWITLNKELKIDLSNNKHLDKSDMNSLEKEFLEIDKDRKKLANAAIEKWNQLNPKNKINNHLK